MKLLALPSILLLIGILLSVPSCTKEYIEDINGVCFERDVLPVFVSNCTQSGCHNSIEKKEGYDLSSYESIIKRGIIPGNYKGSTIYQSIATSFGENSMPPPPHNRLSSEQVTNIALWIDQGAHNTVCTATACDTTNISFTTDILPILGAYCNGCHSGSAPS
ncbi:MAG: hypothetical protein IPJ40_01195 [Saprospirales bacterium]|nr:hypothetical protein [Saprospirales bacterium]